MGGLRPAAAKALEAIAMNRLWQACVLALRNLLLYKLRSFLTALGLIFGVSSVVAMLAIAEGASLEAQRQIADLGATNIILRSRKPIDEPAAQRQNNESIVTNYGLTDKDFTAAAQADRTAQRFA